MENEIEIKSPVDNNNEISLLIVSCDAYKDLWKPFFHCLFKYWPDCPYPVLLGTNETEYNDPRVKTLLIGPDKDYSSNLINMLEHIKTPWVIIWIEDLMPSSFIKTRQLTNLVNTAQEKQAAYLKLAFNAPWAFTKDKNQEIGPIPKGVKYRTTMGLALWKKDVILKLLCKGESAWQIERHGSIRSNSLNESFYCFTPKLKTNPPIQFVNTVIKGKWNRDTISFFKKENLTDSIPNRSIVSLWSFLYIKLYAMRLRFYRLIRKYWYE